MLWLTLLGLLAGCAGTPSPTAAKAPLSDRVLLLQSAEAVVDSVYTGAYQALSAFVGEQGLTLVAFSTADSAVDPVFSAEDVLTFGESMKTHIFGTDHESGLPLEMTTSEYMSAYMRTVDFGKAPHVGINRILKQGNAEENVATAFPDTEFVDFYYPPTETNGLDWISLKVVMRREGADYRLVALVRSVYVS